MNFNKFILFIAIILFAVSACKKNSSPKTNPIVPVDVYVAGYINDETTGVYWKDTTQKNLPGNPLVAHAIAVNGKDVYITGNGFSQDNQSYIGQYWKNGIAYKLNTGSMQRAEGQAIALQDTNVYVAGTIADNAAYWKNGVVTRLTDDFASNYAYGIAVKGSDVYVAGGTNFIVKYWKNKVEKKLTNGSGFAVSTGIALSGNDVYVTGYTQASTGNYVATYWKNGVATKLNDESTEAQALAIAIKGKDIYIAGSIGVNSAAAYWKNGVAVLLTDGSTYAQANGITIYGEDIYITGYIGENAVYWKNGTLTKLTGGISEGLGIAIAPR